MALWKVTPTWKKSVVEVQNWTKGDEDNLRHEVGWRWGEFIFEADEKPTELEEGVFDAFDCGYELVDWSTDDGCWEETDYEIADEAEEDRMAEFLNENSVYDLEEHGWTMGTCSMYIQCECTVEKVEEK